MKSIIMARKSKARSATAATRKSMLRENVCDNDVVLENDRQQAQIVTLQSIMVIVESQEVNGCLPIMETSKQVVEDHKEKYPWLNERLIYYLREVRLKHAISSCGM